MVQARKALGKQEESHDLFSSLLDANEGELESDAKLSDSALIGACFAAYILKLPSCSYYDVAQATSSSSWLQATRYGRIQFASDTDRK